MSDATETTSVASESAVVPGPSGGGLPGSGGQESEQHTAMLGQVCTLQRQHTQYTLAL